MAPLTNVPAAGQWMWPTAQTAALATSQPIYLAQPYNAVIVEIIGGGGTLTTFQLQDKDSGGPGFNNTVDTVGTQSSVTGYKKVQVSNVQNTLQVVLTIASGSWNVYITPIVAVNSSNLVINANLATNLAQYAGATVAPSNPVDVREVGLTWTTSTLAGTTSAQALGSNACKAMYLENLATSTQNLLWGDTNNTNFVLTPGQKVSLAVLNTNQVFVKWQTNSATVNFGFLGGTAG